MRCVTLAQTNYSFAPRQCPILLNQRHVVSIKITYLCLFLKPMEAEHIDISYEPKVRFVRL